MRLYSFSFIFSVLVMFVGAFLFCLFYYSFTAMFHLGFFFFHFNCLERYAFNMQVQLGMVTLCS